MESPYTLFVHALKRDKQKAEFKPEQKQQRAEEEKWEPPGDRKLLEEWGKNWDNWLGQL